MRTIKSFLFVSLLSLGGLAVAAPAHAVTCNSGAINDQLKAHITARTWDAGDALYVQWAVAGCTTGWMTENAHIGGATIAWERGDLIAALERDARAGHYYDFRNRVPRDYGYVRLFVRAAPQPWTMTGYWINNVPRPSSVRAANGVLNTGRYGGYMYAGTYTVGGKTFTVTAGRTTDFTW